MTARLLAAAAAVCTTASLLAIAPTAHAASATVVGEASCLYGGPSWMSSWSVTSEYPFSVYGAGLERTHQFDEAVATLEVLVNVGSSTEPDLEVVATTINRPDGCDGTATPPDPEIEVDANEVVEFESLSAIDNDDEDNSGDDRRDRQRHDRRHRSLHLDDDGDRRDRHDASDRSDRRDGRHDRRHRNG